METKFRYLEIVNTATREVDRRFDVTNRSEKFVDRAESGANINLNHAAFHTRITESESQLPLI